MTTLSQESSFRFTIPPGTSHAVLRDFNGNELGSWDVSSGSELTIDLLGTEVCLVDGRPPARGHLDADFVAFPRMRLDLDAAQHDIVTGNAEVLRRHYARPEHNALYYSPDAAATAFHKARLAQVRRLMRGVRGRVLDVGSAHSMLLIAGVRGISVVACDRDPGPLHQVHSEKRATCVAASADGLPFAQGTFDAVYAGEIVEHLPSPHDAVRGWVSTLRPSGRIVITTPNRTHLMARLLNREQVVNAEHLFEWSLEQLEDAVSAAGATVVHREGLQMPLPVPVPGRGWRDIVSGVTRRTGKPLPEWAHRGLAEAGRPFARWAANLAVVAERRS